MRKLRRGNKENIFSRQREQHVQRPLDKGTARCFNRLQPAEEDQLQDLVGLGEELRMYSEGYVGQR